MAWTNRPPLSGFETARLACPVPMLSCHRRESPAGPAKALRHDLRKVNIPSKAAVCPAETGVSLSYMKHLLQRITNSIGLLTVILLAFYAPSTPQATAPRQQVGERSNRRVEAAWLVS